MTFYCEYVAPTPDISSIVRAVVGSSSGTGTMWLAQPRLVNLTKLGLDTLY